MTNQEAIIQLDYLKDFKTLDQVKALDMAIKALEQEPCENCRNCKKWDDCECGRKGHINGTSIGYSIGECKDYEPSGDLISRQAVFEIQAKYAEYTGATKFWQMRDDIKALPPVKQEPKTGHWKPYLKEGLTDMCSELRTRFFKEV